MQRRRAAVIFKIKAAIDILSHFRDDFVIQCFTQVETKFEVASPNQT